MVPKIRAHWPEGQICGPCFTTAARTYGQCAFCGTERLLPGRSNTGQEICRDCAGITTKLDCDKCGREGERLRGGRCAPCVVTGDLEQILKPHTPPDMRIKRLVTELAAVPRPESIITWMRHPVTAALLTKVGTRELQLSHDAFNALPPSRSLEHLREMLVHHRMMPNRGDPRLARFETWLDQRLETLKPTPAIHTPVEQFARWHHLRRLRENTHPTRNMDNATRCAKQEITEAIKFLVGAHDQLRQTLLSFDVWSNDRAEVASDKPRPGCQTCDRREFPHLAGERRPQITLCGRNSVQIHERSRPVNFGEMCTRLQPHGTVKHNDFVLKFWREPYEMTLFPDGRAIIKGTADMAVARSLYARFVGS